MTLADEYEAFLLDLDGVVYRGEEVIAAAAETIETLRKANRRMVFLTNNSSRSPAGVAEKLVGLGIPATGEDVVTSAVVTAETLAAEADGRSAFVVGEEGIIEALRAVGVSIVDRDARAVDYVVVGWDREADYDKLRTAALFVRRGARLVATNADATFPAPGGELWPGAGSLLAAIETASGVRARVIGKPQTPLFESALERAGTRSALVVGDRIETDVGGASAAGLDGAVVFTGAATPADLLDHDALPVAALEDLSGLLDDRSAVRVRESRPADATAVESLLERSGLDAAAARSGLPGIVVAGDDEVVASAGIETRAEDAYLHSVAVVEAIRGRSVGTLVVAAAVARARRAGAARCYLLTETAEGFFARLGFVPVERKGALPDWAHSLASTCSESAVAMARSLAGTQASQPTREDARGRR